MNTININDHKTKEALLIITDDKINEARKIAILENKGWSLNQLIDLAFLADDYRNAIKSWRAV